jgi:hypothetical protein
VEQNTAAPEETGIRELKLLSGVADTVITAEVTSKELKGGLHLGQMQVTSDKTALSAR